MTTSDNGPVSFAAERFQKVSERASDICRTLGITMIGVVWLLAGGLAVGSKPGDIIAYLQSDPSKWLWMGFVLAALCLALDALQYVIGAILWGFCNWSLRKIIYDFGDSSSANSGLGRSVWFLSRVVESPYVIGDALDVDRPKGSSWKSRKDAIIAALSASRQFEAVGGSARVSFIVQSLFFSKIVALVLSMICIVTFIL